MGSIYFNGSELTGVHDVKFNGSDVDNVYFNGSKIWTQHPYTPGTHLITYAWGTDVDLVAGLSGYWGTYGIVMFKEQPATVSGSAGSAHRVAINLQPGFNFSYYQQSEGPCTDSDGQGTVTGSGQSSTLYSGHTVSGATGFSCGSSGNGGSTIKIGYSGE